MRHSMLLTLVLCFNPVHALPLQDGDLLFQTSRSQQSLAIQRATNSPYSHVGILLYRDHRPYVFEAIATVRYTPLAQWLARGTGGHYVVKRLRNSHTLLDKRAQQRLHDAARRYAGKPYDLTFEWSDQRIYCSELVWKLYHNALGIEVGALQHLRDFNLDDPVVRFKLRERYGDHPPLDETVISPAAVFESTLLTLVERH